MNARQKRFCDEFIKCGKAMPAAINAGYTPKTAKSACYWINEDIDKKLEKTGRKSLYKPELREYIDDQLERIHNENTADAQEVIEYLTSVMRGEHTEQVLRLIGEGTQKIENIDVSEKDRLRAAELIGKRYGMFTDRATLNVNLPVIMEGEGDLEE